MKAQDGSAVANATVIYGRLSPVHPQAGAAMLSPMLSVTTSATGAFSITNLAAATYLLCVEAPSAAILDPCHWSLSPPTFAVAAGQTVSNAALTVARGHRLLIRISDPLQLLATAVKPAVMTSHVGVKSATGTFLPGILDSSDATGLNYGAIVPFDVAVSVFVSGGTSQLSDGGGLPMASGGKFSQVTVPSTGTPPSLVYTLTGVHMP